MSLGLRIGLYVVGAAAIGFAMTWAFLAYLQPDMVVDFATFLQMCGIAVAR
jgi:hypothetical protein